LVFIVVLQRGEEKLCPISSKKRPDAGLVKKSKNREKRESLEEEKSVREKGSTPWWGNRPGGEKEKKRSTNDGRIRSGLSLPNFTCPVVQQLGRT